MRVRGSFFAVLFFVHSSASAALQAQAPRRIQQIAGTACTPSWEAAFGGEPGTSDGSVLAFATFDDGSGTGPLLYAGGSFSLFGGREAAGLARWDGSRWDPVPGSVEARALAVHDDGQGGGPALYAGKYRWNGVAWSEVGAGPVRTVLCFAEYDDGQGGGPRLYAGANGGVYMWDGTNWSLLPGGLNGGEVLAMTVFDDGSGPALFVAGSFNLLSGSIVGRVVKWNGSSWSTLASGLNGTVRALTVYDSGLGPELVAGGEFTRAGSVVVRRIARWDGQTWRSLGLGRTAPVWALSVLDEGSGKVLVAGGSFTVGVARWDGSTWAALGAGFAGSRALSTVSCLAVHDDGHGQALFAGGYFDAMGGVPVANVARWVSPAWSALGETGFNGQVYTFLETEEAGERRLIIGGEFSGVGGVVARGVARWNGAAWEGFGNGLDAEVRALAMFDDGHGGGPALFAAGDFTKSGDTPLGHVAKWDGTSWTALGSGVGNSIFIHVYAMEVYDDGRGGGPALYIAGGIGEAGGVPVRNIAKWDGSGWSPLLGGLSGSVQALCVFDDGGGPKLYAGGNFLRADNQQALFIARWDGAGWSPVRRGLLGPVSSLTTFDDGTGPALYAGGTFLQTGGGTIANRVAKWNGRRWSALGGGITQSLRGVSALAGFDDGAGPALYVGGDFLEAGGLPAGNLARWGGGAWSAPPSIWPNTVTRLCAYDDVGGAGPALVAALGGLHPNLPETGDSYLGLLQGCLDTTAPELVCPDDVILQDPISSPPGEIVNFQVSVVDGIDPRPVVRCVPPSGSLFPPGVTRVLCTATDASGNESTCSFEIKVVRKARVR